MELASAWKADDAVGLSLDQKTLYIDILSAEASGFEEGKPVSFRRTWAWEKRDLSEATEICHICFVILKRSKPQFL